MVIVAALQDTTASLTKKSQRAERHWLHLVHRILYIRAKQSSWHAVGTWLNRDNSSFIRSRLSEIWLQKRRMTK